MTPTEHMATFASLMGNADPGAFEIASTLDDADRREILRHWFPPSATRDAR